MNERSAAIFAELYERHPRLRVCEAGIVESFEMLVRTFRCGGKLMLCGNGGSAADCSHIVGELMKGFCLERAVPSDEALAIARAAAPLGIDGQRLADSLQLRIAYGFLQRSRSAILVRSAGVCAGRSRRCASGYQYVG